MTRTSTAIANTAASHNRPLRNSSRVQTRRVNGTGADNTMASAPRRRSPASTSKDTAIISTGSTSTMTSATSNELAARVDGLSNW